MSAPDTAEPCADAAPYCGQCGQPVDAGGHERCRSRAELDPPRYCAYCRRRMKVQVTPTGWSADCSVHGRTGADQG